MKNTKVRKLITRAVALLLVGTMAVTDLSVETMASTVPETQDLYIQTLGADNSASILDKGFDRSQMSREEKEKFDEVLELSFQQNKQVAKENGWSKKEYLENMEKMLNGSMEVEESEDGKMQMYSTETVTLEGGKKVKKKKKHGWLSVGALATAFNIILSLAVGAAGVGSLKAMVTQWGKEKAKQWVRSHIKRKIIDKVKFFIGTKAAKFAGGIVIRIVNACLNMDPGLWLARQIDKNDKKPSNGYIEIFA